MKRYNLLAMVILIVIPVCVLSAAPFVQQFSPPPPGQYNMEQLWKVTLNNPDSKTYEVWLDGTITEAQKGQVFWAKTNKFQLPPGTKVILSGDIQTIGIDQQTYAPGYDQFAARSGGLPEGDYTFTVKLMPDFGGKSVKFRVEPTGAPRLMSPNDNTVLRETQNQLFTWLPPTGKIGGKLTYELTVAEILPMQTAFTAMRDNKPMFKKSGIATTNFKYAGTPFEKGKQYAWQVRDSQGGASEVWVFLWPDEYTPTIDSIKVVCHYPQPSGQTCYDCQVYVSNRIAPAPAPGPSSTMNVSLIDAFPTAILSTGLTTPTPVAYNASAVLTGTVCFSGSPPTTVNLLVKGEDAVTPSNKGQRWSEAIALPPCGYNCCKDFSIAVSNLRITQPSQGLFRPYILRGFLSAGPNPICRVRAEIVTFSYRAVSIPPARGCSRCVWPSRSFGNFGTPISLGTLTPSPVLTTTTAGSGQSFNYSREFVWQGDPASLVNVPFNVRLFLPTASPAVGCCLDTIRMCIRFSFTDTTCGTCDTVISFWFTRDPLSPLYTALGRINGGDSDTGYGLDASGWSPYQSAAKTSHPGTAEKSIWLLTTALAVPRRRRRKPLDGRGHVSFLHSTRSLGLLMMAAFLHTLLPTTSQAQPEEAKRQPLLQSARIDTLKYIDYDAMRPFDREKLRQLIQGRNLDGMAENTFLDDVEADYRQYAAAKRPTTPVRIEANGCINGNFEQQYSTWSGAFGLNINGLAFYLNNVGTLTPTAVPLNTQVGGVQHNVELATAGSDANIPSLQRVHSGSYSMKLNNGAVSKGMDVLTKTFSVDVNTSNLTYWYALVLQDPGHGSNANPFFMVRVRNSAGNLVPAMTFSVVADVNNPFFQTQGSGMVYRNWTCQMIDLNDLMGQQVTVEFIASDCSAGAHYGYAYIDDICVSCIGDSSGSILIDSAPPCDHLPTMLTGSFQLPVLNGTTGALNSITLGIYHNGSLVATLTNPVIVGSNYSFALGAGDFPTVTNPADGYDFVATASFTMSGYTYTKISGTPGNGIISGTNNDYLLHCPNPCGHCCDSFAITVRSEVLSTGAPWRVLSRLTTGPKDILEVRATLVNFYVNQQGGCDRCVSNNVQLGSLVPLSPGSHLNWGAPGGSPVMVNPTSSCAQLGASRSPRELAWNSIQNGLYMPRPPLSNEAVTVRVVAPSPHVFQGRCCFDTLWFAIRWSFTDVDCRTCDTLICYTVPVPSAPMTAPGSDPELRAFMRDEELQGEPAEPTEEQ